LRLLAFKSCCVCLQWGGHTARALVVSLQKTFGFGSALAIYGFCFEHPSHIHIIVLKLSLGLSWLKPNALRVLLRNLLPYTHWVWLHHFGLSGLVSSMSFLSGCTVAHTRVSNLRDCSPHRLCRAWLQTICPLLWRLPSWLKGP
jgi:hypothetical protein